MIGIERSVQRDAGMTLTRTVFEGTSWTALSQVGRQVLQLTVIVVLARLLSPGDIGVVAMATVVTGFVALFSDLGTSAAVIQKAEHSPGFLSAVFWLNLGFGVGTMLVVTASASWIAAFYGEPRLTAILVVLSVSFPLTGLFVLQRALLERAMDFQLLARVEMFSTVSGGAVGILVAFMGGGIWALVMQSLVSTTSMAVLLWVFGGWRPRFEMDLAEVRGIVGFSGHLTGFNVINYFSRNADYVLIGRLLGSTELGYYSMAYRILMFPLQNLSSVITRVTLPAFSRIQGDDARFRSAYLRCIGVIALLSFPLMALVFTTAKPFVQAVLGEPWLPVVPLLLIFSPVGLVQSVGSTVGVLYIAKNRTALLFRWGLYGGLIIVTSFIVGLNWGIIGVAGCYAVVALLLAYPGMSIPLRLVGLSVRDSLVVLWRSFVSAVLMGILVVVLSRFLSPAISPGSLLAIEVTLGLCTYALLSTVMNRRQLRELWSSFRGEE